MGLPKIKIENQIKLDGFFTMFEAYYPENFSFSGEKHNFWEMVYVIDGQLGVSADSKVYTLSNNQIIFHKPMEFHKLWSHGGTRPRLLIISFSAKGPLMNALEHGVFHLNAQQKTEIDTIINYLRSILPSYCAENSLNRFENVISHNTVDNSRHLQRISHYLELFFLSISGSTVRLNTFIDRHTTIYHKAIKIMEEHVCENPSVSDFAEMCAVSESYLKSLFFKYSGIGIHKYFLKLKINRAMQLLADDFTVAEISNILNFNNPNYFSQVFKREVGFSPSQYKKQM